MTSIFELLFFNSVYPCVYREHIIRSGFRYNIIGLSLCIQGTCRPYQILGLWRRFIPVYTGNISSIVGKFMPSPVYPCVYREHNRSYNADLINSGLSLCIQGTLDDNNGQGLTSRFIPVYTGNIPPVIVEASDIAVYPCVYREHIIYITPSCIFFGLSLCIQGTYENGLYLEGQLRFIPVYTGNIN